MTEFTYPFPRPAVTVDIMICSIRDSCLQALFIKRAEEPYKGFWALPGGFIKIGESLEEAAARELEEETGIVDAFLEQLYTYGDPNRDPRDRIITIAYYALIAADKKIRPEGGTDAEQAAWFPVDKLPDLAFDHTGIVQYALRRLRYKLEYSAVGFELLPRRFTLSELQTTYEIILGEQLDKRNFRRRILDAGIIEATKEMKIGEGRPARLYRYRDDAVSEVKARRLFP